MQSVVFLNVNFPRDRYHNGSCIKLLSFPVKLSSSEVPFLPLSPPSPERWATVDRYGSISWNISGNPPVMGTTDVTHDAPSNDGRRVAAWCVSVYVHMCVRKHIYAFRNGTKSRALDGNGSACHSWIHKHVALLYIHATGAANNLLVA